MEEAQMKKRNKYLDFLCFFSGENPIPTQNVELINVY
jgi:hypothetical protein